MESEICHKEAVPKQEYPCLMECTDSNKLIVLFTEEAKGTVVASDGKDYLLGEYRHDWLWSGFRPFVGTVTLSETGN